MRDAATWITAYLLILYGNQIFSNKRYWKCDLTQFFQLFVESKCFRSWKNLSFSKRKRCFKCCVATIIFNFQYFQAMGKRLWSPFKSVTPHSTRNHFLHTSTEVTLTTVNFPFLLSLTFYFAFEVTCHNIMDLQSSVFEIFIELPHNIWSWEWQKRTEISARWTWKKERTVEKIVHDCGLRDALP